MKKSITILIALLLGIVALFGAFGCSSGTKNDLQRKIDELQSQLEEMDEQLRERDERIKQLEKELGEMQDYVLRISADKETYGVHEEILIDITLENQSGADVEIAYYLLFVPESPTGQFPTYEAPPVTTKKTFKNGESIHRTERLGGCFPVGRHELRFRAVFYLSWEMTEFGWETTNDTVEVYSNTIKITVNGL